MFSRASRSLPWRVARSMWRQARFSPSSAMPSAGGLKAGDRKVSIHPRGRRQRRRQAKGQYRVADRDLGHDERRDHADLAAIVEDEDRAPAHFAAGAGSRRDGDDGGRARGDAIGPAFDDGKALQRAVVCGADGHAFGQIDGRAAAHGDDAIAIALLVRADRLAHGSLVRVRRSAVINGNGACMPERVEDGVDDAGRLHAPVRHDQRTADANPFALLLEQADGAELELDLGNVIDEGHGNQRKEWGRVK
jgi:hypothetical protein